MSLKQKYIKRLNNLITGIDEIDVQHKDLFDAIQALEYPNKSEQDMWDILLKIEIYACTHFDTEEGYMEKFNYPIDIMEEHKKEHKAFLEKFIRLKKEFEIKGFSQEFIEDFQNFLLIWIGKHYKTTDIKLAEFLSERMQFAGLFE